MTQDTTAPVDSTGQTNTPLPVVQITKLWKVFTTPTGEFVIHKDLDLTIQRGEVISIVGGSGTGKTVLLRQILGLETPTRGHITISGAPVSTLSARGAASKVGMLFQHGALFSAFSVLDNIAFALRELGTLPDEVIYDAAMVKLQMVGLEAKHASKMPADLSGGMVKRVALARALIMDPPLLLLDEPTAGLDPASADGFCTLLRSLHQELGLTVVMVTHDLDTLFELSSRVAVLADQKVIVTGTVQEVMAFKHPFIEQFFLGERGRRASVLLQPHTAPPVAPHGAPPDALIGVPVHNQPSDAPAQPAVR
jgi:phospholipid/cholesterol/gamma-HCH transport system ATP-binding protein